MRALNIGGVEAGKKGNRVSGRASEKRKHYREMNWRMKSGYCGFQDQVQHGVCHCFTASWLGDTGMKFTLREQWKGATAKSQRTLYSVLRVWTLSCR